METYHLVIDDVDEIIPELSTQFKIGYNNKLGEFFLEIPSSLGEGSINGINFPNGIGLYTYHCKFYDDVSLQIAHRHFQPLRFIYCMEGELTNHFSDRDDPLKIKHHQHLAYALKKGESHEFLFHKDVNYGICYLEIDRRRFKEYLSFSLDEVDPIFYQIFSDIEGQRKVCQVGKFSIRTAEVIKEIKNCDVDGFPRISFMGAKSLEILSYMLYGFKKTNRDFYNKNLKEKDLEAIEKTVQYIDENIANTGTVQELAKYAGVNTNKLQEGFHAIYGKTVNEYLRDVRLKKSLSLLSSGKKNVSEVVYELGLSSRSYFSKIFKEKYGISPRKVLAGRSVPGNHFSNN